jgi:hypothetical protein
LTSVSEQADLFLSKAQDRASGQMAGKEMNQESRQAVKMHQI